MAVKSTRLAFDIEMVLLLEVSVRFITFGRVPFIFVQKHQLLHKNKRHPSEKEKKEPSSYLVSRENAR